MNTSFKYQANWTKTVGGVVRTRLCGQTDCPTDRLIPVYPHKLRLRGYNQRDYYLFPKMKKKLSGHHFHTDDDVKQAIEAFLDFHNSTFGKKSTRSNTIGQSV